MAEIHQIQAPNHRGRYGNKFGQRYTSRDGCAAFQGGNLPIKVRVAFSPEDRGIRGPEHRRILRPILQPA